MRKVLLAAIVLAGCSQAEPQPSAPSVVLGDFVIRARFLDKAVTAAMDAFRAVSRDGQPVTEADFAELAAARDAAARGRKIGQLIAVDLNGDGAVATEEAEASVAHWNVRRNAPNTEADTWRRIDEIMIADADGNGSINLPEMIAAGNRAAKRGPAGDLENGILPVLVANEPGGDGKLEAPEVEQIVLAAFKAIDADGNDEISVAEAEAYQNATAAERRTLDRAQAVRKLVGACDWPGLPNGVAVLAVSARDGSTVSNLALGDVDERTRVVYVDVEPGAEPLHVLVGSQQSVIWAFQGAVERIQAVAVASSRRSSEASGVHNIERSRVTILPAGDCIAFPGEEGGAPAAFTEAISTMLRSAGAGTVQVALFDSIRAVRLPALMADEETQPPAVVPAGFDEALFGEFVSSNRGGLAQLDASLTVARAQPVVYDVYPEGAGLAQLAGEGILKRSDQGRPPRFMVLKPMRRYPPGLHGVIFVQPESFPLPKGKIGMSCLVERDTGRVLKVDQGSCVQRSERP